MIGRLKLFHTTSIFEGQRPSNECLQWNSTKVCVSCKLKTVMAPQFLYLCHLHLCHLNCYQLFIYGLPYSSLPGMAQILMRWKLSSTFESYIDDVIIRLYIDCELVNKKRYFRIQNGRCFCIHRWYKSCAS